MLNEDALGLVVYHSRNDVTSLRSLHTTSLYLSQQARRYLFQNLRLRVKEDALSDILALVWEKPYLLGYTSGIKLVGLLARDGEDESAESGEYPVVCGADLDTLLYSCQWYPKELKLANFRWKSGFGGMRVSYPIEKLSVHNIRGFGPRDCPADLVHSFGDQQKLIVSGMRYHPCARDVQVVYGDINVLRMDVDMIPRWRHSAAEALAVKQASELCFRNVHSHHMDWVAETVGASSEVLSRLTLSVAAGGKAPGVSVCNELISYVAARASGEWEMAGLSICDRLEEVILVLTIVDYDVSRDLATVLCMILITLPPSLTYLEIRFKFDQRLRLYMCSSITPACFEWDAYALILGLLPMLGRVVLCLVHEDSMVRWRNEDQAHILAKLAQCQVNDVTFLSRMALATDVQEVLKDEIC